MTRLILGLASYKGGVGKTTSAIHLAGHLATACPTLLIDGDRTKSATTWARHGRLPFDVAGPTAIARRAGTVDYLVIDSRGGLDDDDLIDLAQNSDLLLLPSNPELMSLDAMAQTAETLQKHNIPAERSAVLLTMTRPGRKLNEARDVLTAMGLRVLESTIRQSEAFRDASAQGVLVRDVRTNDLARSCWEDYSRVTAEILGSGGQA